MSVNEAAAASTTRQNRQDPLRAGDEIDVLVDRLAYGGQGVARAGNFVVFVDHAAPGDRARVRLRKVQRRFAEAEIVELKSAGPARVEGRCRHFRLDRCGGCAWQHISAAGQTEAKQELVRDALVRVGGFNNPPMRPIIAAPHPFYFRNKMEFAFAAEGGLGLHPRGAWDRVFRLEECFLQSERAVQLVKAARAFAADCGLSLWNPRSHQGFLREFIVRESAATSEVMVGLVTAPGPFPDAAAFADHLRAVDPRIASVMHGVRAGDSDGSPITSVDVVYGEDHITERLQGLSFRIGLQTFFQTNSLQADVLVRESLALAGDLSGGLALDVYCGVGVFSLALARRAAEVVGVEVVAASIESARENAFRNGIENAHFYCGDARLVLPEALAKHGPPRVVLLDPPRAGAGGKVMRRIARAAPERIVYVSCNPTTLARDLQELSPFGYEITAVQPVDMFPQTYHIETVVALTRTQQPAPTEGPEGTAS